MYLSPKKDDTLPEQETKGISSQILRPAEGRLLQMLRITASTCLTGPLPGLSRVERQTVVQGLAATGLSRERCRAVHGTMRAAGCPCEDGVASCSVSLAGVAQLDKRAQYDMRYSSVLFWAAQGSLRPPSEAADSAHKAPSA